MLKGAPNYSTTCFAAMVIVLIIPLSLRADNCHANLELKIALSQKEIVQHEPVVLKVSVNSQSANPVQIRGGLEPIWDDLHIKVTDSTQKIFHHQPSAIVDGASAAETLPPNGALHHRIMLSAFPEMWMDKPGKYRLCASFDYAGGDIEPLISNTVTLMVNPAKGVDKQALVRFRGYPQARFFAKTTTAHAIGDEFESIIWKYPDSAYSPWCHYIVGWAEQNRKGISNKSRAVAVRRQYGRLLEQYPKFPLKVELEYEMARELLRLGKREEAIKQIGKLAKDNPELLLFRNVNRTLSYLRESKQEITAEKLPSH